MEKKSSIETVRPRSIRRPELSIIFFTDASKTRTMVIALSKVKILATLALSILIWAVLSIWIIFSMVREQGTLGAQVSSLLATIFDYQTRYDSVYENAYPTLEKRPSSVASQNVVANQQVELAKTSTEGTKLATVATVPTAKPSDLNAAASATSQTSTKSELEFSSSVGSPHYTDDGTNLIMNFDIKNLEQDTSISGQFWAVASFKNEDGHVSYIPYPTSLSLDAQGKRRGARGTRFSIKRFKPVSIQFARPGNVSGSFTNVVVGVQDDSGKSREFSFPVTAVKKPVAIPEETEETTSTPALQHPAESIDQDAEDGN